MMQAIPKFKIRCSAIGQIMTNGRGKSTMGETAKKYCETWLKEQLYGRRKEIGGAALEKGNVVEDNSIDFAAEQLDLGFLIKNEQYYENEYLTGTPDIVLHNEIIDIKSSWDCFTFPLLSDKINTDYYWQAQGYMELVGRENFRLCYCLMDTPQHLIERTARRWCYDNGYGELDQDIYEQYERNMTYSNADPSLRIKTYEISRDRDEIQRVYARVEECREYINSLLSSNIYKLIA